MQIDYVSGFIRPLAIDPGVALYDTGTVLVMHPGGEIEHEHSGAITMPGSFESKILCRTPDKQSLYISGNPVKHLQGHNLYGPTDAVGLYLAVGLLLRERCGLFPGTATWNSLKFAGPEFTRLDITRSYRFSNQREADEFLRYYAATARTRHGAPVMKEGTVTFGKGSSYWEMTVYPKLHEISSKKKGHKLNASLDPVLVRRLKEWAEGVVRFELRLRSKEIQRQVIDAHNLRSRSDLLALWYQYYGKVEFNMNPEHAKPSAQDQVPGMKPRHHAVLALWRTGADLRAIYPRDTFYRYRNQLRELLGIDIASPPPPIVKDIRPMSELDDSRWDPEPLDAVPEYSHLRESYPRHLPEMSVVDVLKRLQRA